MQRYVSDVQLAKRYDVSRSTVWRWASRGILPEPVRISPGVTRWRFDEIERRDAERDAERGSAQ
jgi:predicted DNA-binding transcriptional regulator AlpA